MSTKPTTTRQPLSQRHGTIAYTFPLHLLKELVRSIGKRAFDPEVLELEQERASQLAGHPQVVGYDSAGGCVNYTLLAPDKAPPWNPSNKELIKLGTTRVQFDLLRKELNEARGPLLMALRGYAGWLVTNPQYVEERDQLFTTWKAMLQKRGIPRHGQTTSGNLKHSQRVQRVKSKRVVQFLDAFKEFYARWRLQHLVTFELPEPLAPQIPVLTPLALLTHMKTGGVTLYLPDTMPIPSRDHLIGILEDVRRQHHNNHLANWLKVTRRNRTSDHSMRAYGRLFILQHYWSILEDRHATTLKRNVGRAEEAFSKYFNISQDVVKKDRQRIRDRLQGK
ncbi:MAG: hypothetical protein ACE5FA_06620 [Dehalococcoidia bacterium]